MPAWIRPGNFCVLSKLRWCGPLVGAAGFVAAMLCLSSSRLAAQPLSAGNPTIDRSVRPASVDRTTSSTQPQSVRFALRAPLEGDQIEQTISQDSQLTTYWRQGREIANTTTSSGKSNTRRVVTAAGVRDGRTVAVLVRYLDATSERVSSERPNEAAAAVRLPVIGKTYRCERRGGELLVVDEQGNPPPKEELEIVRDDMESVGRPTPLAEFLGGNSVTVGQTIAVPPDLAGRMLGLSGKFGELTKFELTLREVRVEEGAECGVFQANIEAASHDSSQLRLILNGPLVVQIQTCRAVEMKLTGPIAMSESRGSLSASYQLISTGRLSMNLSSKYRDAGR